MTQFPLPHPSMNLQAPLLLHMLPPHSCVFLMRWMRITSAFLMTVMVGETIHPLLPPFLLPLAPVCQADPSSRACLLNWVRILPALSLHKLPAQPALMDSRVLTKTCKLNTCKSRVTCI
ncbi:hypothetical protein E2C01_013882 [Portunus trituberculatus]|uniref:Uncharacterized protein n=1 Tax=Portunus trituberculatus TaxID=210409 RepID=A0A5B7DIN8_PORTR|nr:hypothetical protein [Portunus trituberculatus]